MTSGPKRYRSDSSTDSDWGSHWRCPRDEVPSGQPDPGDRDVIQPPTPIEALAQHSQRLGNDQNDIEELSVSPFNYDVDADFKEISLHAFAVPDNTERLHQLHLITDRWLTTLNLDGLVTTRQT